MAAEADAIYSVVKEHSRLFLAMAFHETKLGTLFTVEGFDATFKNPVALMTAGEYLEFATWAGAASQWIYRLVIGANTYKGGVYSRTVTLEDLVHVYAPAAAGNDEARYVTVVEERLAAYGYEEEPPVAGTVQLRPVQMVGCSQPVMIPADLQFRVEIIPAWQTNQRPGIPMAPEFYTQHETGNPSFGAGAVMHSRYMHTGAGGQQLGYHLTIDDGVLIQMVPLNEVTWHAGDGAGQGNYKSIACELCINSDSDLDKSRLYAAIVAAGVMQAMGIEEVVQHNHWSGKDCPHVIRSIGYWDDYLAVVAQYRTGQQDAPPYAPADVLDLGEWDGEDRVVNGTTFHACRRKLTARTTTKRYRFGAIDSASIGPDMKKGDKAEILYVFQAKNGGTRWGYSSYGTRFRLAHFTPYVTITPQD